jgi:hypothetical protein
MISAAQNVPSVTQAITWNAGMRMAAVLKWAVGLGQSRDLTLAFLPSFLRGFPIKHPNIGRTHVVAGENEKA